MSQQPPSKGKGSAFVGKKALLLDMNGTFMFGEDRFEEGEDFSVHYSAIGGTLSRIKINSIVRIIYDFLSVRYPDPKYRNNFPSIRQALAATCKESFEEAEVQKIVATFGHHELGTIPPTYVRALRTLKNHFTFGAVIDIWSPKTAWEKTFRDAGIYDLFGALSFSSDLGSVKPSPKPFQEVLRKLEVNPSDALVIGDSIRRDLGGAKNAGIECILVGGAQHQDARGNLYQFA